jgi:beta-lactamase superfamily II metal-dependent hydrolase
VNLLVLGGTDQDHADADGLEMLWNRFGTQIKRVWHPGFPAETDNWKRVKKILATMKEAGVAVWSPTSGYEATFGELGIKVLSPHPADSDTSNNASIVVKITAGEVGFLFRATANRRSAGATS